MSQILYVAVIYFCVGKNCAMISDRFPYETKDKCSTELSVREKDLRSRGVDGVIDGRCIPVELNNQT